MHMDDEESDDYGSDESEGSGEKDDFTRAVEEAFPDDDWTPERVSALKEAIRICYEEDESKEDMPESSEPAHKGKGIDLAVVFGGPKGKK